VEARGVDLPLPAGPRWRLRVRHPELRTSKGTIQLRAEDTANIADEELRDLARAALDG
jgi:hypothetical protein